MTFQLFRSTSDLHVYLFMSYFYHIFYWFKAYMQIFHQYLKEATFVTSCVLSCIPVPRWIGVYSSMQNLLPIVDPFSEGIAFLLESSR